MIAVLLAYVIGSIPFALILGRQAGIDVREVGSGNPGATNVARAVGPAAGAAVALLDIAKGSVSVLVAYALNADDTTAASAGLAAVVGHVYPVWLRFRGGKGVAAAGGVFLVLAPIAIVPAIFVFAAAAYVTKYVSAGSVLAAIVLPPLVLATGGSGPVLVVSIVVAVLVIFRHRSNLVRLRAGTERRFSLGER